MAQAALDVSNGKVEANLGGGVYKKRIATKGRGKSGSVRTILAFKVSTDCCSGQLKRSAITVVEECGHMLPIEQPQAVTALIRLWLSMTNHFPN